MILMRDVSTPKDLSTAVVNLVITEMEKYVKVSFFDVSKKQCKRASHLKSE